MQTQAVLLFVCSLASACLGPPFLYVTFHDSVLGWGSVEKFSRDGCSLGNPISADLTLLTATRGMAIIDDYFYLASSKTSDSRILQFGQCSKGKGALKKGVRPYIGDFITQLDTSLGLDHPYGIAVDRNEGMYISCQNTDCILRFDSNGNPMPAPSYFNGSQGLWPGLFAQFDRFGNGARGLDFVGDNLWAASEDAGGIDIIDPNGFPVGFYELSKPIGVHYDAKSNLVYLSSRDNLDPKIIALNPTNMTTVREYRVLLELHPTGMVVHDDMLFVIGQITDKLYTFNTTTGELLGSIVKFDGTAEEIALSPC